VTGKRGAQLCEGLREARKGEGQTQGAAVIMTLPQENWGQRARRRDLVKHGLGWDTPLLASMYGSHAIARCSPRRPGLITIGRK